MFIKGFLQSTALLPLVYTTASAQTTGACNNSPSLCSKPYNNVTYLGAHNSAFLRDKSTDFSTAGNHYYDTTTQLDAGVRMITAQVHKKNGTSGQDQWHLCHSTCDLLDAGTLASWLGDVKTWMDANTNEVVTILLVNSDGASATDLGPQFQASGIDKYAYSPPTAGTIPQSWPTLQSMISNNTRLVTFVASLTPPSTQYPYLLDEFTYVFENDFENETPASYSCEPNRPTGLGTPGAAAASGRLFLQNHFLYSTGIFGIQTPNATYVNTTNAQSGIGSLGEALSDCSATYGKAANFVLVDFFNVGPAIASIDNVNGVSGAVGRKTVSTEQPDESETSGVAKRGASLASVVVAVVVAIAWGL